MSGKIRAFNIRRKSLPTYDTYITSRSLHGSVRVRKESPNTTPPMTPANVASVSALPLRQPFTFSFVNLAMVWPLLVLLALRPHFLLGGRVLERQHLAISAPKVSQFCHHLHNF